MATKGIVLCLAIFGVALTLHAQAPTPSATQPAPALGELIPAHPATVQQIHEYFAVTHSITIAHKLMDQMVGAMQATGAPYLPKAFWDDLRTSFAALDLESSFVPAYQKYFSEEDMSSVLSFYKSPAGQRLLETQPLIASFSQEQLRKAGEEIGRQAYERHKDEIETARKKYEATPSNENQPPEKK